MPFVRVKPDDLAAVTASVELLNAAQRVDDPDGWPGIPELTARQLEFGWDLEPDERYLYVPDGVDADLADAAVGVLDIALPLRDNLHLVWAEIAVHPDHRGVGHGHAIMDEVLRRAREAGRTTVWVGTAEDDATARDFLQSYGFGYASHDARRRQVLADVDQAEVERLFAAAKVAASDYELIRLPPPVSEDVLTQLVEVTAAINDAPMGDLTYEDEKFDLQRLKDMETARDGRGDTMYRVAARHKESGEFGGHTVVVWNSLRPTRAGQGDTAVARNHRGHKLGMLLKIEMMHWIAEEHPEVEIIETWNNADNRYMIDVNEAIGYRLSRVFDMYELTLQD
jgi:GNAT superfamily N-acetyltransferase